MAECFIGTHGWADPIPLPPVGRRGSPAQDGTLSGWLLYAPWAHPAWQFYIISAIHLRPIEGSPPAKLKTPNAAHELLVVALHPDHTAGLTGATYLERQPAFLTPVNVAEQFEGTTDEEMVRLVELCARAVANGILHPEPAGLDFLGVGREAWRVSLWRTLEHIRHGGHPPDD